MSYEFSFRILFACNNFNVKISTCQTLFSYDHSILLRLQAPSQRPCRPLPSSRRFASLRSPGHPSHAQSVCETVPDGPGIRLVRRKRNRGSTAPFDVCTDSAWHKLPTLVGRLLQAFDSIRLPGHPLLRDHPSRTQTPRSLPYRSICVSVKYRLQIESRIISLPTNGSDNFRVYCENTPSIPW